MKIELYIGFIYSIYIITVTCNIDNTLLLIRHSDFFAHIVLFNVDFRWEGLLYEKSCKNLIENSIYTVSYRFTV